MTTVGNRTSDHEIDPLFLERWSPRAFTGEAIPEEELMRIFEAARWAPSSYNSQPWRFVYARRDTPHWEKHAQLAERVQPVLGQERGGRDHRGVQLG